jgi:methylmalonyl-CoA mutase
MNAEKDIQDLLNEFPAYDKKQWVALIEKSLKGEQYADLISHTEEGIAIEPIYTKEDIDDALVHRRHALLKRLTPRSWKNRVVLYPLEEAQDLEKEAKEWGADEFYWEQLPGATPTPAPAYLLDWQQAKQAAAYCIDPLTEKIIAVGAPLSEKEWEQLAALMKANPHLRLSIQGRNFQEIGLSLTHTLAYTMAAAITYGIELRKYGIDPYERMEWCFSVGSRYFMEVVKLRSARLIWYRLAQLMNAPERLPIQARTALYNKTTADAHNNMLRATVEMTAAVVGGADVLTADPYDYISGQHTAFSRRISRNLPIMLKDESYLNKVQLPASGSYFVEAITSDFCKQTWQQLQQLQAHGWLTEVAAIEHLMQEVNENVSKLKEKLQTGKQVLLGVNKYPNPKDQPLRLYVSLFKGNYLRFIRYEDLVSIGQKQD